MIYNLLEAIRIAAHLLMPLMPQTSAEALRRLSCEDEARATTSRAFALGACLPVVSPSRRVSRCSRVWAKTPRHIGNLLFRCKGMAATVHALLFQDAATMLRRQL